MSSSDIDRWYSAARRIAGTPGSHPIGLRVESVRIRVRGVTPHEAIAACIDLINEAGRDNQALSSSWKSIMDDGTVFISLPSWQEPSRSVAIFLRCEALVGGGVLCSIDVHVPIGVPGDRSHYRAEASTAYIRGTQSLYPSIKLQERRSERSVNQTELLGERAEAQVTSRERESRTEVSEGHSYTHRTSTGAHRHPKGEHTAEDEWFSSEVDTESNRRSERSELSQATRRKRSDVGETSCERHKEVTFTAVGPDLTAPSQAFASWLANPDNRSGAQLIECIMQSASTLAEAIPAHVGRARASANLTGAMMLATDRDAFRGSLASKILVESSQCAVHRQWIEYDGSLRPIDAEAILGSDAATVINDKLTALSPALLEAREKPGAIVVRRT